jgi:hypothetical protein
VKKALTILTAFVLIASGMHVSRASHYCEGKLAAVKLSVTGEKATCGMESCMPVINSTQKSYTDNCCENHVSVFLLDYFETTTLFELSMPGQKIIHIFQTPVSLLKSQEYLFKVSGFYCPESLSSSILCVFRI